MHNLANADEEVDSRHETVIYIHAAIFKRKWDQRSNSMH